MSSNKRKGKSFSEAGKMGALASKAVQKEKKNERAKDYLSHPNICKKCFEPISYEKRRNQFCSRSCSASFNNVGVQRHGQSKTPCKECGDMTSNLNCCSRKCYTKYRANRYWEKMKSGLVISVYPSAEVKKALISRRGASCETCENDKWQGVAIPLNVHHVDGDAGNNRPNNLQLLCLNCHGLTPNFGRKNKKCTRDYRYKK